MTFRQPPYQPRETLDPPEKDQISLCTLGLRKEPLAEPSLFQENDLSTSILKGTLISTGGSGLLRSAGVSFLLWPGLNSGSTGGPAATDSMSPLWKEESDSSLAFFLAARGSVTSLPEVVEPTRRGM